MHLRAGVQNHYSHRVRIGNWNEDQELKELQVKEYAHRKNTGTLLAQGVQAHLDNSLQQVGLSFSRDGTVKIGAHVMVYSAETQGVLSCDTSDRISLVNPAFCATTSTLTKGNVARNTFVIEGYGRAAQAGSSLKYGQTFRLRLNPALGSTPVYLSSQPKSHLASSHVSKQQLVSFSGETNFDTAWQIQYADHNRRFEMEGEPVQANAEVVIVHQATRNPLASETKHVHNNDFGPEFEVCCKAAFRGHKNHELTQEFRGKTTTDCQTRGELSINRWAILTAQDDSLEALLNLPQIGPASDSEVLAALRDTLLNRFGGAATMIDLGRRFRISDRDKSDSLSYAEFAICLQQIGFNYSQTELKSLSRAFDPNSDGTISYQEFLRAIRGDLSPARLRVVNQAFDKFDRSGNGVVNLEDLTGWYDASQHPEVKAGKRSPESVLTEFLNSFEGTRGSIDGVVTRDEFIDYYSNLSAFIDTDVYFTTVVQNAWKL